MLLPPLWLNSDSEVLPTKVYPLHGVSRLGVGHIWQGHLVPSIHNLAMPTVANSQL